VAVEELLYFYWNQMIALFSNWLWVVILSDEDFNQCRFGIKKIPNQWFVE